MKHVKLRVKATGWAFVLVVDVSERELAACGEDSLEKQLERHHL